MTFCFLTPSATGQLLRVSDPQAANLTTVSGDIRWSVANDTGKGATHVVFYWEDGAGNPGVWHPGYLHEGWYDASVWHPGYYEYVWHEGWWENTTWHEGWFEPVWHGGYFEEVWRSPHYEDVYHGGWNEDVWHEGYTVEVYHDAGWYGSLWHEAWTESIWHEGYSEQVWRDAYTEEVFHEGHWDQTWHEPYYEYVLFGDYYEDVYHEGYWNQLWHDGYWENTTWHDAYGEYISHDGWYEQVQHEGYWEQTDVWHPDYEDEDGAWHAGYWEQVWHEPYTTQLWHEPYSDYVWHEAYWDRVWHDSYWENTTYNDGYTEHVWHGPHYENVLRDGYWENTTWHNAETEYIYHPEGFQDVWHDGYTDEVYHDGYWDDYAWHDAYTEYVIHEGYNSQIWHDAYYEQVLRDGYTEQVWHPEYYEYIPHDGYWDQVWHESYTEAVWHEAYSEPGQWHPPYWVKGWWEGGSANLLTASAASDPGNGSVSVSLPSLWPGHTYNYFVKSVIAADTDNVFDASNDTPDSAATAPAGGGFFQFTTPSAPLISITDLHYENLTARGADIVWTVTNDSGHPATHALYYAADNPGANLNGPFLPINGSDGGTVRVGLSSLAPGSANFVVVQSTLTGIEGYDPAMLLAGGSLTVTTPSILRITNAPSRGVVDVASRSTTLNWGIENNSGQSVNNTVTYSWSGPAGSGSGQATAATAADQSQVSVTISNLQAGATYTFNASSSISSHEGDAAYSSSISSTFTVTAVEMPPTTAISIFNVSANPDLISDTMALVTWNVAYTNVNDYGTGSHFVLVSSNAPPTAVEQVLLAEGQEDSSGNVWAVLSGLSAGQTNYFSVQSILGPSTNRFAIDDNGGLYYSFTNTVTGQIPDDPWNETIAIVQPPVAGFVSDTNAVISWQVTPTDSAFPSHFVIYSTNNPPTLQDALIAPAVQCDDSNVVAVLTQLQPGCNYRFGVQSVIDFTEGRFATNYAFGLYYPFTTLPAAGQPAHDNYSSLHDGIPDWWKLANAFSLFDANLAWMDADGDGFSNLQEFFGGSGPRDAGSKPDGGTGGESAGGWTDGVPQQATMTVHIKLTSAAVREWMAEGNDGSGDYAGAKLKWTGTDGVSDEKEIKTDGIGASDWEYPNIPDSTLKETDVNIPVKPGETYSFTFEWTKRPSVPGYEISANVSMNSTNCLLARSEDKRKSWGASTIRSGSGWSPPDGAVTTGYFYDYYESNLIVPIYVYPDEEDKSGPEKAWQIKVVRTQLQSVCFGGDGNVRIKDINDKFANTTGPFIQAPELNRDGTPKSKAVCYAQGTAPQLTNVTLKLSANIGEDAVNITLQGVATVRGSKLRFVGDGQLKGDSGTVSTMEITYNAESDDPGFTNILPANIDSTDLSIKWTLCFTNNVSSSVDGVWSEDLGTTKNDDLFLIWGKPAPFSLARWPWTDFVQIDETDITYCRLKKICDREMLGGLSLESDPDEIARKIAKVVMGPLNTEISLLNSNGKALLSAWEMLDGKEADCLAESILMKQVLELVGIRDVAQARKNSSLSSTI